MNMAVLLQYVLPKQAITALAGKLAHYQGGNLTTSCHCLVCKTLPSKHGRSSQC